MPFTYTRDIPDAPNNPSNDQPNMKTNTNSIDDLIDVDHYTFSDSQAGKHTQVRMPTLGSVPSISSGQGGVYTKSSTGSQLFYSPDGTGNEYQMTRTNSANFSKFATNNAYGTPPAGFTQNGGWTFLPGGMIFQYGFYGKSGASGSSGTIQFPFTFSTGVFSISIVGNRADTSGGSGITVVNTTTTSSFTFIASTSGNNGFYWTAIGI